MSQDPIQVYTPGLPDELKDKVLMDNSNSLAKLANNRAATLLASLQTKVAQAVTSATYKLLTGLSSTLDTSGGLIIVVATLHGDNGTANAYSAFGLFIDGVLKTSKGFATSGGSLDACVTLVWIELLAKGSHRFEVKASTSGGTLNTPYATVGFTNELFITEIII